MLNRIEANVRRISGKTELIVSSGKPEDRQARIRQFDTTLDGLATTQAEAKNASLVYGVGMSLVGGFVPITMFSILATRSLQEGLLIGLAGAGLGFVQSVDMGKKVEEANASVRALREKVYPGNLPPEDNAKPTTTLQIPA